jgi:LDH2 family malate/lactate/ureidoglycolate dehydrogenase
LPGERGGLSQAARSDTGIPIAPSQWEALGRLARELAIELPATVAATQ